VTHGTDRKLVKTFAPVRFALAARNGPTPGGPAPGAEHEFRRLILPHLDGAYNLARYLTRDAVLSEDVVQDAVLRAFRAFGQFRGGSAKAWLFAIVRNCSRTAMTVPAAAREAEFDEEVAAQADGSPTPEEEVLRKSEIDRVRFAVEAIPEPFREAVVLRDLEELSYAEIAEVTGVPVGTVMSRLSRGRAMLARELLPSHEDGAEQTRSVK
jgi:RNA polymerase sigma-70 factor (ECF subfamily)